MIKIIDRNYGSIPHLSISKMSQQADKKIGGGQENILTKKARDWKDLIIVTEKIDGSNVGIYNNNGKLEFITRAGYHVDTSKYEMHHQFKDWCLFHDKAVAMFSFIPNKWRIVGEWCAIAHGTIYDITNFSPFIAFDIFNEKNERILFLDFYKYCFKWCVPTVPIIHIGQPISIKNAIKIIGNGLYGNPEKPEGVVYRCEREGRVDFLAKYVRSDKQDGKYLEKNLWNKGYSVPPRMADEAGANGI